MYHMNMLWASSLPHPAALMVRETAKVLYGEPSSPYSITATDLREAAETGLDREVLRRVVDQICYPHEALEFMYRIVPRATFNRRTVLSPEESERTERLARVFALAEYTFESADRARDFLNRPHHSLGNKKARDLALTEMGARQVETHLWQGLYGVFA